MRKYTIILSLLFAIFSSCDIEVDLVNPVFTDGSILDGANEIPKDIRQLVEGVYKVNSGKDKFGQQLVLKWQKEKLAVYGSKLGIYFILDGGIIDSTL